jgi:hypothetical protein
VILEAFVARCAFLDRMLLVLGGRFWMQRLLEETVARLAPAMEASNEVGAAMTRSRERIETGAAS